mmetsp:Transcript_19606/g.50649  ORF Transcript_19606/g.50649 Transcript_19606/m.50649 type:complete len:247 (+) Transcript_19606:168-908(+)
MRVPPRPQCEHASKLPSAPTAASRSSPSSTWSAAGACSAGGPESAQPISAACSRSTLSQWLALRCAAASAVADAIRSTSFAESTSSECSRALRSARRTPSFPARREKYASMPSDEKSFSSGVSSRAVAGPADAPAPLELPAAALLPSAGMAGVFGTAADTTAVAGRLPCATEYDGRAGGLSSFSPWPCPSTISAACCDAVMRTRPCASTVASETGRARWVGGPSWLASEAHASSNPKLRSSSNAEA